MKILHLSLADWAEAYCGFTPEQEGWAIRLTRIYASREKLLDDDTDNARMMGLDIRVWKRAKAFLVSRAGFFIEDGHIKHERIERDLLAYHEQRLRAAESGRIGGQVRQKSVRLPGDFPGTSAGLSQEVREKSHHISHATHIEINDIVQPSPSPSPSPSTTVSPLKAAREPDRPTDPGFAECKSAFNGSTEAMLAEVERAMVGGDRAAATAWLGSLLRADGQEAVSQAYQMLLTAKGEGKLIARVLPWWSKTASSLKAKSATAASVPAKSRTLRELEYLDGAGRCP